MESGSGRSPFRLSRGSSGVDGEPGILSSFAQPHPSIPTRGRHGTFIILWPWTLKSFRMDARVKLRAEKYSFKMVQLCNRNHIPTTRSTPLNTRPFCHAIACFLVDSLICHCRLFAFL